MKLSLKITATTLLLSSVLNMPLCGSVPHVTLHVTFSGASVELDDSLADRLASTQSVFAAFAGQHGSNEQVADFIFNHSAHGKFPVSYLSGVYTTATDKRAKRPLGIAIGAARAGEIFLPRLEELGTVNKLGF